MQLFLSTYYNKVDAKGRTSVPAPFRDVLKNEDFSGVIINKSFFNECIEGASIKRMESLSKNIESMNMSIEVRDALSTFLLGNSVSLLFDGDGRITIPKKFLSDVGIVDQAVFVGKGKIFEIWSPSNFEKYMKKVTEILNNQDRELLFKGG